MDFSKILPAIATAAPTIATLLGGPLAGMGVQALEGVFGLEPGTAQKDPQALVTAVANMTPDTAVKLAQLDADLKAKLAQAGIDLARLDVDDRANARGRATAMHDWTPTLLGGAVIMAAFGMVIVVVEWGVAKTVDPMLAGGLIMALIAIAQQAGNYMWGSSAGSAAKNALLDKWADGLGSKKR